MSARSFRSVFMVASCAGAALGCYLVSLRVASERAALEEVESQIVMAERDIRMLQTEIGTRGRLAQLERWNVKVLALSAPNADQFLEGGFALARLVRPQPKLQVEAPVVLASAPADAARPQVQGAPVQQSPDADESSTPEELLHVASLKRPMREAPAAPPVSQKPQRPLEKATAEPKAAPGRKAASASEAVGKKAGDKKAQAPAKPVTKAAKAAKVDPLAPQPKVAGSSSTAKETGSTR